MRDEINLYLKLMTDIKHRLNFINLILGKNNTTGSIETNVEFCCLQLRKILELISLSSLVMNKSVFEKQNVKYEKFWNSRLILQDIERINSDFYPKPIVIDIENSTTENRMLYDMKDGFLTKQEFINVYEKCGKILHNENPYGTKIDYDYYGKQIKIWSEKIIFLLKLHMIKLYKGDGFFLVYVYNATDNNVHAIHYPSPK